MDRLGVSKTADSLVNLTLDDEGRSSITKTCGMRRTMIMKGLEEDDEDVEGDYSELL